MDIKIVDDVKEEFVLSKKDLAYIKESFHEFGIEPTDEQALSIVDRLTYYEIKKWGVDDTCVRDHLYESAVKLMAGSFDSERNHNDYKNYNQEVFSKALLKGFKVKVSD